MVKAEGELYYNQNRLQEACDWLLEGLPGERGFKQFSQNHRNWLLSNGYFKANEKDFIAAIFAGGLPKKIGRPGSESSVSAKCRAVRVIKVPTTKGIIYLAFGLFNSGTMAFTSHFFDRYKERCMANKGTRTDAMRHFFLKEFFGGICGTEDNQKNFEVKHTKAVYRNGIGMGVSEKDTILIKTYVSNAELNDRNFDLHKNVSEAREAYEEAYYDQCLAKAVSKKTTPDVIRSDL